MSKIKITNKLINGYDAHLCFGAGWVGTAEWLVREDKVAPENAAAIKSAGLDKDESVRRLLDKLSSGRKHKIHRCRVGLMDLDQKVELLLYADQNKRVAVTVDAAYAGLLAETMYVVDVGYNYILMDTPNNPNVLVLAYSSPLAQDNQEELVANIRALLDYMGGRMRSEANSQYSREES